MRLFLPASVVFGLSLGIVASAQDPLSVPTEGPSLEGLLSSFTRALGDKQLAEMKARAPQVLGMLADDAKIAQLCREFGLYAGRNGNPIEGVQWLKLAAYLDTKLNVDKELLDMRLRQLDTPASATDLIAALTQVPRYVVFRPPNKPNIAEQPKPKVTPPTGPEVRVTFQFDRATLDSKGIEFARALGVAMQKVPDKSFLLIGHTDEAGTEPYNLKLSLDRSSSVRDFVVSQYGVASKRISIEGRGKLNPLYRGETHDSPKARLNRRVELVEQ